MTSSYSTSCTALDLITDCLFDFYYADRSTTSVPTYYTTGTYYTPTKYYFNFKEMNAFPSADYPSYPVMDHFLYEDGTHELRFAVPFCRKEDILIKIEDDLLIVKKKSSEPVKDKDGNEYNEKGKVKVLHNKIATRDFEVSFKISDKLDTSKIASKLENGILCVKIPLSEEIKKKERIIPVD